MPQFTEMRRPALWDGVRPSAGLRAPRARTVVLGYDGSESARRALECAAEAAGSGGRVVVVTAVQRAVEPALGEGALVVEAAARLLDEASELLSARPVDVSTRVEEGEPGQVLVEAARDVSAALIVVGARGDSYLARALRGSVGERLVARAPCDLLVVR
jgi:nucleotide-binding universal stress UspA family protein